MAIRMGAHQHEILRPLNQEDFVNGISQPCVPFAELEEGERYRVNVLNFGRFAFNSAADEPEFAATYCARLATKTKDPVPKLPMRPQVHTVRFQVLSLHGDEPNKTPDVMDAYSEGLLVRHIPGPIWQTTMRRTLNPGLNKQIVAYFLPYEDEVDQAFKRFFPAEESKPPVRIATGSYPITSPR